MPQRFVLDRYALNAGEATLSELANNSEDVLCSLVPQMIKVELTRTEVYRAIAAVALWRHEHAAIQRAAAPAAAAPADADEVGETGAPGPESNPREHASGEAEDMCFHVPTATGPDAPAAAAEPDAHKIAVANVAASFVRDELLPRFTALAASRQAAAFEVVRTRAEVEMGQGL